MNVKIALIRGDGIGPEVVGEAVKVLEQVGKKFGHTFTYTDVLMGGCAIDQVGKSYPDGTAEALQGLRCRPAGRRGRSQVGPFHRSREAPRDRLALYPEGSGPLRQPASCRSPSCSGRRLPSEEGDRRQGH